MTTTAPVQTGREGDVVIIRLQNPPVNVLDRRTRTALLDQLESADRDPAVRGIVVTGTPNFSAGADLAEFDSGEGLAEPTLHLTIAGFLDAMRTPTVAAIHGAALGGGLELALACSARVADPAATLGLPECTLGFMPGAGGTQRLPRAIGIEAAIDLIVTGRSVTAEAALSLGLVDAVETDPVASAVALARRLARGPKPRLRDRSIDEPLAEPLVETARRALRRAPRANAGVAAALEAVRGAVVLPFDQGLAREYELFEHLAGSSPARAARYRFLSDRAAGRAPRTAATNPIRSAAVIGAGTMGRGIALALLTAGIRTTVIDADDDRAAAGHTAIVAELDRGLARGRLTAPEHDEALVALTCTAGLAAAADADLVIEAVFENLQVKREVFARLDEIAKPAAILASNTSSLDLDAIARATSRPESVVGMHFFSPAQIMRLVEVVRGEATSPQSLASTVDLVRRLGKIPVVSEVGPGFIGNRIFDQYVRQAQQLLQTGASPARIDAALEAWGMAMGPFRVLDIVGNDVPAMARGEAAVQDPAFAVADGLVAEGWLGRKTGIGWYDYTGTAPVPNDRIRVAATSAPVDDDELVRRCVTALVVEACSVLGDGVADSAADIDTVLVHGYGFPPERGGPLFHAESQGWTRILHDIVRWREETGDPFWIGHPLLEEKAAS